MHKTAAMSILLTLPLLAPWERANASNDTGPVTGRVVKDDGKNTPQPGARVSFILKRRPSAFQPSTKAEEPNGEFQKVVEQGKTIIRAYYKDSSDSSIWFGDKEIEVTANLGAKAGFVVTKSKEQAGARQVIVAMRRISGIAFLPSLLFPASMQVMATADGRLGLVRDSAGSPVAGSILVTDLGSGRELTLIKADRMGRFTLDVRPGQYLLTIIAEGYLTRDIVVRASTRPGGTDRLFAGVDGQRLDLSTLTVEPETVIAAAVGLAVVQGPELEDRTISRLFVFSAPIIAALPLGGIRRLDDLALLTPGILPPPQTPGRPGASAVGVAGQFTVNGIRGRDNNFTGDGSDNNDEETGARRQGLLAPLGQPIESVAEFQVISGLPDARFGRGIGGQFNALSVIGQNRFHANAYGLGTDSRLMARDPFDMRAQDYPGDSARYVPITSTGELSGVPVRFNDEASREIVQRNGFGTQPNPLGGESPHTRIQSGFALGGPILLNFAYFQFNWEWQRVRASEESHFAVPTVRERGVFGQGDRGLTVDGRPTYPVSLPGNATFSLFPFPNNPLGPYGANTFTQSLPADATGNLGSLKVDHRFAPGSRSQNVSARLNRTRERTAIPAQAGAIYSTQLPRIHTAGVAAFVSGSLTARLSHTVRVSYGQTTAAVEEVRDPSLLPSDGFPSYGFLLNKPLWLNTTLPGVTNPEFTLAAASRGRSLTLPFGPSIATTEDVLGPVGAIQLSGFSPLGVDSYRVPESRRHRTYQVAETATLTLSRHQFVFGVDWRRVKLHSLAERNVRPQTVYPGVRPYPAPRTICSLTGCETVPALPPPQAVFNGTTMAAAGTAGAIFQTLAYSPNYLLQLRRTQTDFFGQDSFRVTARFQFVFGFRLSNNRLPKDVGASLLRGFDRPALGRQVEEAIQSCAQQGLRANQCTAFARSIATNLPANFNETFGKDRVGNDFRLGFVWGAESNAKTVLRGGAGNYTAGFPAIIMSELRGTFPDYLPLNLGGFECCPVRLRSATRLRSFLCLSTAWSAAQEPVCISLLSHPRAAARSRGCYCVIVCGHGRP